MEQENSFLNEFEEKEKLGTLKTLTILTFIGSGIVLLFAIWGFFTAQSSYDKMLEMQSSGQADKLPSFVKDMYSPERMEMMRKSVENRLPLFIINFITGCLCIFGAIKMRQRKADGYWIWLIGELLPFLGALFFIGAGYFSGMIMWITLAVTATFVILYTTQRKYLS